MQHYSVDTKTIAIKRLVVSSGSRMRRYVPASRGRALPYEKISSNVFVEVEAIEKPKKVAKPAADKAAKPKADKTAKSADKEDK